MAFDPDEFLKKKDVPSQKKQFDPDAFLASDQTPSSPTSDSAASLQPATEYRGYSMLGSPSKEGTYATPSVRKQAIDRLIERNDGVAPSAEDRPEGPRPDRSVRENMAAMYSPENLKKGQRALSSDIGDMLYSFANIGGLAPKVVGTINALTDKSEGSFDSKAAKERAIEGEVASLRKERSPTASTLGGLARDIALYETGSGLLSKAPIVGAGGAGKTAEALKLLARGGILGAGIGQASGNSADDLPRDAAIGAGFEAIGPALGTAVPWVGKKMRDAAPSIVNKMLNVPVKDLVAGKNLGKELVERGLVGTESGLAKKAASKLNENEELLQGLLEKASIPQKPAIDAASGIVEDIATSPNRLDNKFIVDELRNLKEQFQGQPNRVGELKRIDRMIEQYAKETPLTFSDANEVKRGIYRRNANAYSRDINPIKTEIDTSVARGIKKGIEEKIPEAGTLNRELGFYKQLSDLLEKKAARAERGGGSLNLKDLVGSTAAGAVLGPQAGGAAYLASMLRENPLVATMMAKLANKSGNALELLGKNGRSASFVKALTKIASPAIIGSQNQ